MRYLLFLSFGLLLFSCKEGLTVEQQLQSDIEKIKDYLNDRNLTAESTASGLHYIITAPGSGGHPSSSSTVTVNYTGKLLKDEKVFDQTNGTPATFPLQNLIEGWQEGIPLLQKGGKAMFFIPSALGYGPYGKGDIPANAPLIFDIELVGFK
jgi:FKBP-type peptidyl-prolyl cis-trans isomerase FkpA